jgi:hypothetical protein
MTRRLVVIVFCMLLTPALVRGQSLFSTHGLGVPTDGVDARGRALGISGVGLLGLSTSLLNPAQQAGTVRRGVSATFQPWTGTASVNGEAGSVGGTRFPLIEVLYPVRRITFTVGFSGLLDQSWGIRANNQQVIGTDTLSTEDVVEAVGGVGQLTVGGAIMVTQRFALGASLGLQTGNVERTVGRIFTDSAADLLGFTNRSRWNYSGKSATVGFRWDPGAARVGASVTFGSNLDAKPQEGSTTTYSYDMPLRIAAGASARLSARLLVAASTTYSQYGDGDYAAPGITVKTVADNAYDVGAGLEWANLRTPTRVYPLRLGFRYSKLPFHNAGDTQPKEWAASTGIGFRLVEDEFGPLAVADIGLERGKRTGWENAARPDGLSETFWRFTASISLFGR